MSRVAKMPVQLPKGVEFKLDGRRAVLKGPKGELSLEVDASVEVVQEGAELHVRTPGTEKPKGAMAGTVRALLANMAKGVSEGFQKKLELVGVGYRAQAQGKVLNLTLGFSHPVAYQVPEGITIETPSQTEVLVTGIDRQKVGQVAADIRGYRPPEPYKGKGVRYSDERVVLKEAKKK
ncbi:50S ribosomal protein L6 [Thioalkalivibrio sp. XN279]|uniref:50S ribosomal protein L6 n=1 Tax=Thioalkalivibrio sp. XN279 TaxID=2714953 RepID=UPI001407A796|nr:50S ribosomal protein L6 [Thioalkalivibrio sp. XN279]NHA15214.1 50S ribosomal protein L6 [Thioalkalivibrio sp. XN279]